MRMTIAVLIFLTGLLSLLGFTGYQCWAFLKSGVWPEISAMQLIASSGETGGKYAYFLWNNWAGVYKILESVHGGFLVFLLACFVSFGLAASE